MPSLLCAAYHRAIGYVQNQLPMNATNPICLNSRKTSNKCPGGVYQNTDLESPEFVTLICSYLVYVSFTVVLLFSIYINLFSQKQGIICVTTKCKVAMM